MLCINDDKITRLDKYEVIKMKICVIAEFLKFPVVSFASVGGGYVETESKTVGVRVITILCFVCWLLVGTECDVLTQFCGTTALEVCMSISVFDEMHFSLIVMPTLH